LSTRQQDEPLTVCFFCPRFVENGDTPTTLATKLIDKVQKTGSTDARPGPTTRRLTRQQKLPSEAAGGEQIGPVVHFS